MPTRFGSNVGNSLEKNNFDKFAEEEANVLKSVKRLHTFEKKVFLEYEDFYIVGFIDSISKDFLELIDYKTGGLNKDLQYSKSDYIQLQIYALGIKQEYGVLAKKASVEFITIGGNAYKGESLYVKQEKVKSIDIDITMPRLKEVYHHVYNVAKEIDIFYNEYRLNHGNR